jgi:hypothetical protein
MYPGLEKLLLKKVMPLQLLSDEQIAESKEQPKLQGR